MNTNTQINLENKSETQTNPNTTIVDTTLILSRRKKRRISSGW